MWCGIYVLRHLQKELTWAIDKQLQVINNERLFKMVMPLRNDYHDSTGAYHYSAEWLCVHRIACVCYAGIMGIIGCKKNRE